MAFPATSPPAWYATATTTTRSGIFYVGVAPANTVAPAVTGTTTVGSALTTTTGTWTDDGSPTFTYQWQRDTAGNLSFSNIGSATSSSYTLVTADLGNKVRCQVTDTDGVGSATASSNAVGLITAAVPAAGEPFVTNPTLHGFNSAAVLRVLANDPALHVYSQPTPHLAVFD